MQPQLSALVAEFTSLQLKYREISDMRETNHVMRWKVLAMAIMQEPVDWANLDWKLSSCCGDSVVAAQALTDKAKEVYDFVRNHGKFSDAKSLGFAILLHSTME